MHQLTKKSLSAVLRYLAERHQFLNTPSLALFCGLELDEFKNLIELAANNSDVLEVFLESLSQRQTSGLRQVGTNFGVLSSSGTAEVAVVRGLLYLRETQQKAEYNSPNSSFKRHVHNALAQEIGEKLLADGGFEIEERRQAGALRVEFLLRYIKPL
jgi:hypothetical protein